MNGVSASPRPPRLRVLPNSKTPALLAVLVAMWYAGASQGNAAAYLLCFLLAALALVSLVHAWSNLRGLDLRVESLPPVFAGEELSAALSIKSTRPRAHYALEILAPPAREFATLDALAPAAAARVELRRAAPRRGRYAELAVRVRSDFPLGFFTAHSRFTLARTFFVYPPPQGDAPLPRSPAPAPQLRGGVRVEGEDYAGVRAWQPGESQRHIDWKAAARGQSLLTKQWAGESDDILRLDWETLAPLDAEARLSQLAKWILRAERGAALYELRVPGQTIPAGRGDTHCHACLEALATFPEEPA